jgi:hypothetical protein
VLKAAAASPRCTISRQYFDAQDRLVMASVGLYPSDRFSHNTRFRIQQPKTKETDETPQRRARRSPSSSSAPRPTARCSSPTSAPK